MPGLSPFVMVGSAGSLRRRLHDVRPRSGRRVHDPVAGPLVRAPVPTRCVSRPVARGFRIGSFSLRWQTRWERGSRPFPAGRSGGGRRRRVGCDSVFRSEERRPGASSAERSHGAAVSRFVHAMRQLRAGLPDRRDRARRGRARPGEPADAGPEFSPRLLPRGLHAMRRGLSQRRDPAVACSGQGDCPDRTAASGSGCLPSERGPRMLCVRPLVSVRRDPLRLLRGIVLAAGEDRPPEVQRLRCLRGRLSDEAPQSDRGSPGVMETSGRREVLHGIVGTSEYGLRRVAAGVLRWSHQRGGALRTPMRCSVWHANASFVFEAEASTRQARLARPLQACRSGGSRDSRSFEELKAKRTGDSVKSLPPVLSFPNLCLCSYFTYSTAMTDTFSSGAWAGTAMVTSLAAASTFSGFLSESANR